MSVVYFKAEKIGIYIFISYDYSKKNQKIILKEIKFFNEEEEMLTIIEQKGLKIIEKEDQQATIENLKELIKNYLSGKSINLYKQVQTLNIDLELEEKFPTEFSKKVIRYLNNNVNFGDRTSYSEIGKKIGSKAYRAIGNILKKNPLPLIIPCHRVIRKNRDLGGFMGKKENTWQQNLKKKLLSIENPESTRQVFL